MTIVVGRLVQAAAKLRGGGTALPGLVVEKLEPDFAVKLLSELPLGVVLVSGTNGKTTSVKVVTELLQAAGLKVFTNNTGSNFMRGVISSLLRKVSIRGHLDADIAVLELDEAHAVSFVSAIKPRYTLLLNVMRDQMDRFGEISYTAELLTAVACNTTDLVVLNREDALLAAIPYKEKLAAEVRWFGLTDELRSEFTAFVPGQENAAALLASFSGNTAHIKLDDTTCEVPLTLKGIYNAYNATAALALVHAIVPETPVAVLTAALSRVHSPFGRGESVDVNGTSVELILVKNPSGFDLALRSFDANDCATMITISDDYGDGRDVSWLYEVDFGSLEQNGVAMVSGSRAFDMALRLEYNEVALQAAETDLKIGLDRFLATSPQLPHRIFCSYTTMLSLRKLLASQATLEQVI
ncbi:MAG: MurT ligase domain-containing protein [Coriobacteriales bacterium]|jgi:UDP-N-acetylmuramyl tripeptide synthase|nr:MurT ligase domain-containing protein [Coriobacteriales bacterium]